MNLTGIPNYPSSREPLSREVKLSNALVKRINKYIDQNKLNEKTLIEINEVLKEVVNKFGAVVKQYENSKK